MKLNRIISLLVFFLLIGQLFGQTRPDQQPTVTDPNGSDAFYSQERGFLYKYRLDSLRGYYAPDVVDTVKSYTPGLDDIPAADRYSIILAADSNYYYIDKEKDYVQIGGGGSISAVTFNNDTLTIVEEGIEYKVEIIGGVGAIVSGYGISVDDADSANPVISADTSQLSTKHNAQAVADQAEANANAYADTNDEVGGIVETVDSGYGISVDDSTAEDPVVSADTSQLSTKHNAQAVADQAEANANAYTDANAGGSDNMGDHNATEDIDMNGFKITAMANAVLGTDAINLNLLNQYISDAYEVASSTVLTSQNFDNLTTVGLYENLIASNGATNGPNSTTDGYLMVLGNGTNNKVQLFFEKYNFGGSAKIFSRASFSVFGWRGWAEITNSWAVNTTTQSTIDFDSPALEGVISNPTSSSSTNGPGGSPWILQSIAGPGTVPIAQFAYKFQSPDVRFRIANSSSDAGTWGKLWHENNDGSGSGLDAGLLQGQTAAEIAASASGDDLGDHELDQDLISGSNLFRHGAATGSYFGNSSDAATIYDGANSFGFTDGYFSAPSLTAEPTGSLLDNPAYYRVDNDGVTVRQRLRVLQNEDYPDGFVGTVPQVEFTMLTDKDYWRRSKLIDSNENDYTSTADGAEAITELAFSAIPAGSYTYIATIYHSKDAGGSTARADFEFLITGSFDSSNAKWLVRSEGFAAIRNISAFYTGTAYPTTGVYKTVLELEIQFLTDGGSITPEIEGEITSGSHDFINIHEGTKAVLELNQNN